MKNSSKIYETLNLIKQIEGLEVHTNVEMSKFSRWRIGGLAPIIVEPENEAQLTKVVWVCNELDISYLVVGGTSNLLFTSNELNGVVIHLGQRFSKITRSENSIQVESGAWVPCVARATANMGLSGIEHVVGIPGSFGGLVCMNGGSQRKGIGDSIASVNVVKRDGALKTYTRNECDYSYRNSIFMDNGDIVTSVNLKLTPRNMHEIRREMLDILKSRRAKFPLKIPNCGSVFVSNPKMYDEIGPPGFAIEKCGLKGYRVGNAQVSALHANFFVNLGGASSEDMVSLISKVHDVVRDTTGFSMPSEVRYVSDDLKTSPVTDCMNF